MSNSFFVGDAGGRTATDSTSRSAAKKDFSCSDRDMAANVGPGWDYYLDRLVTAFDGADLSGIVFEPYLERSEHYRALFR